MSKELANALRVLAMDAVQKAGSGHPGMPMGMADIATVLWRNFLKHNPRNPHWLNRDRFILSNGHGSMLLYALLHLTGYALSLEELKNFRQLNSKTPGHPEYGITPGVEATTGPLGQGFANAVGIALAEKCLAEQFNRPKFRVIDHFTYVFLGDGCLMEGISHETASFAGCFNLGKLIAFWDDNGISIDGKVTSWFRDDTAARFRSYGWHVIADIDGHNPDQIQRAIEEARSITDKPSFLCCKTIIGFGAPHLAGTASAHGAPLGEQEIEQARRNLGWAEPPFVIPENVYRAWDMSASGLRQEKIWSDLFRRYQSYHPDLAIELMRRADGLLPEGWEQHYARLLEQVVTDRQSMATRKASQKTLNYLGPILPELLGGSADLTESNGTYWQGCTRLDEQNPKGNYIHYGVREFAMSAIMNGLALHGALIPYGGTFLAFSDYARNAIRLAALMRLRVIFIYTHDSIGLGEDGPTHQPIEHINSLRLIPNLSVWRPCDFLETAIAWRNAIERKDGPSCLLLSRQPLTAQAHDSNHNDIYRGGYVLLDSPAPIEIILIATGSEVQLAVNAAQSLKKQGKRVRVVSMPSANCFEEQTLQYQQSVLLPSVKLRVCIEAGSTHFWHKYAGEHGKIIGIDHFGTSAPGDQIFKAYNITTEFIIAAVHELLFWRDKI
jgi:transketolase